MMDSLLIEGTNTTPRILFDVDTKVLSISGKSIPADAHIFFAKPMAWLKSFLDDLEGDNCLEVDLNMEYFNTASHKYIAELLNLVKIKSPKSVVNWKYHIEDDEMKQIGEIFMKIFSLEFRLISYDN